MTTLKYVVLSSLVLLTACQKQTDTPVENRMAAKSDTATNAPLSEVPTASTTGATVIVAETPATLPPPPIQVQQMDVPIFIEGTPALLHPIVTVIKDNKVSAVKAMSDSAVGKNEPSQFQSQFFSNVGIFDYQTNIDNLVFENIDTQQTQKLFSTSTFKIRRVLFPYIAANNRFFSNNKTYTPKNTPTSASSAKAETNAERAKDNAVNQRFMLTAIEINDAKYAALPRVIFEVDETTNPNSGDKMALYMSDNFGHGITRLHPANQFLVSSEWVEPLQRFYFITQADSDSNGVINDKDQTFHYYIDFTPNMPLIKTYRY